MEGRLDDYRWAGPYIASRQVVAVNENSDIYKLGDLEGKNLAVQSTTKPEGIFLKRTDERIPKLGNLISLGHRELIYTFLGKGYVDAVGAHEESVVQYMKDYDTSFRILEEPLMITGIGVAFAKDDDRGICEQMSQTLEEMRQDGTSLKIIEKYLLKNPHATFVSVQPKVGLTTLMEEEEKKKLEDYMETLSDEQKEALVKETEELKKYQEEPTPSEDLKCIPLLTREDMKKEAQPFKNEMKEMVGVPVLHHDIFTNGIEYFRCFFDVKDLEEYTPYLSLLSELISAMDTEKYTKLELSNEKIGRAHV